MSTTNDDPPPPSSPPSPPSAQSRSKSKIPPPSLPRAWLQAPAPIRRLFAAFPLQTLPANPLPGSRDGARSSSSGSSAQKPTLYVFTTQADSKHGAPSFNPSCLKWQTWLRVNGVEVQTVPSSNHASPSGALPYLLPANGAEDGAGKPVPAGKLYNWALDRGKERAELGKMAQMREDAYLSLVESRIRAAWLHTLYLTSNFHNIVYPLYIASCSSVLPVRLSLAQSLKTAARESLHQLSPRTSPSPSSYMSSVVHAFSEDRSDAEADTLYQNAWEAFSALSTLLGEDDWFFGAQEPGLLDVSLFAYTHLLLDDELGDGWADTRARRGLQDCGNLVRHRKRLYKRCYA